MKIAQVSCKQLQGLVGVVAFGLCLLVADRIAQAQQLSSKVREHAKKATGQVAMGKKVTGEDKIEVHGWGSGWFVNGTGLMVTNDHVVNLSHYSEDPTKALQLRAEIGITQYRVTLNGGTDEEKTYRAELMYQNESADLALLQVQSEDGAPLDTPHYLSLAPSREIVTGQRVTVLGYPQGPQMATSKDKHAPVTTSGGNVTAINVAPSGRIKKFKVDAQGAPGNSGGPVVNERGELIGVLVEGGADVSVSTGVAGGLIPADVVADLLRAALGLNKIETDLAPFLHLLVNRDLEVFVPGRQRLAGQDTVEFTDGETMTGKITDPQLPWKTQFGTISVSVERSGYVVNDNGTARLLVEGGERLSADAQDVSFKFTTSRGREIQINMSNLRSVLFRKPNGDAQLPDRQALELEGDGCRLFLADVHGDVNFKDQNKGSVTLKLEDIRKVETKYYKQHVHKIDGSKLVGEFEPHTLNTTLAVTEAPLSFSLQKLKFLNIGRINPARQYGQGVTLKARLQIDDQNLVEIADSLEAGSWKKAGALLDELMEPAALKSKPKPIRKQIETLHAEYLLRKGDYEEALKGFKGSRKAKIEGVRTYALGRYHVLKLHPQGHYRGGKLSDPMAFAKAAKDISNDITDTAGEIMSAHRKAQITNFRDWKSLDSKVTRLEKDLQVASSLMLGRAERTKFLMWRFRQDRNWETIKMLSEQADELRTEIDTRRANNKPVRNLLRKLNKFKKNFDTVQIKYKTLRREMNPIGDGPGYRVDDPAASAFLN